MKAITTDGGVVAVQQRPEPRPQPAQVRVRTRAMALNNADVAATGDRIAGYEFSGVVEAVGKDVSTDLLGRRVMGSANEAFAEFVVAHHRHVLEVPDQLGFADAAALPTGLSTEYGALRRAGLRQGDTVLITAATSGIGLIGIQVAHALGAGVVIGTTRNASRAKLLRRAGADHVIVSGDVNLADRVRELTGAEGADVVLDHLSGPGLSDAIDAARPGGSVVSVGRIAGATAEINMFSLARRQIALRSVSYGFNPPEVIADLLAGVTVDLADGIADGSVRAIIDSRFPFEDARDAYARLSSGKAQGKVVLTLD